MPFDNDVNPEEFKFSFRKNNTTYIKLENGMLVTFSAN